jgi:hypothetical protein
MAAATSIRELIANIAQNVEISVEVIQGTVTKVNPLKVTLVNDTKIVLTSTDLIIPQHLTSHEVSIDGSTVTVDNSLKKGEKVHLLSFNNGKKFYVLDKV